jgi:AraC-like DNA-binding protein
MLVAAMLFLKHVPGAPLGEFAEYLWLLSDAPGHALERILPTGTLELVINLHEDQVRIHDAAGTCRHFSGTILSGAYSRPFVIETAAHALAMGVHFRPGGAYPFTHVAPGELADSHVELASLWGSGAERLREHLGAAGTHPERFRILESALLAQLIESRMAGSSVQFAQQCLGGRAASVREIVRSTGLSHRYFTRRFCAEVGMTPKLFLRVQRFQHAIAVAGQRASSGWASLASEAGYYDQAHLHRDFAAFAHATPGQFLRQRSDQLKEHHVLLG